MTTTKIIWKNPQTRIIFNTIIAVAIAILLGNVVLAFAFGGGFWLGVLFGSLGVLAIYGLGEFAGAYDEKIVVIENESVEGTEKGDAK